MKLHARCLAVLLAALGATAVPTTSALAAEGAAASPPEAPAQLFAVIVTNNRSTRLDRPDLQYADDDGARYHQLFAGVAAAEDVRLLTRFDRATAATYPALAAVARPPRQAELLAALEATQAAVARARRAGKRTELYFVYAGHGDVEAGAGYLDLEDGRIDSAFLERAVVDRIAADVQHIVLDSCNSFFVVNPRKPGGRRFATPKDLALGFASRHPNVGLFLSTNSEAEVYEWSELESGIFSHEVRSGLSGAADADGDGRVSYAELAGFVDRANAGLPRANLRPQVFQRGPGGQAGATLFATALARGRRIVLGTDERRLWIRGPSGERLVDLHKEAGPMTVVVPGPPEQPLSIVEWRAAAAAGAAGRPSLREYEVAAGPEPISLAALAASPTIAATTRGGAAMFGDLFKVPYGPRAFAAFVVEETAAAEPVFGLTAADEARMRHYLASIADSDRERARAGALYSITLGAALGAAAASVYFDPLRRGDSTAGIAVLGALSLGVLGHGLNLALSKPIGPQVLESFDAELRLAHGNRALALAHVEARLDGLARRDRLLAGVGAGIFGTVALILAGGTTLDLVQGNVKQTSPDAPTPAMAAAVGYGLAALTAVEAVILVQSEPPTERLLRLYRSDPDLKLSLGLAPTPGGLGLSVGGHF